MKSDKIINVLMLLGVACCLVAVWTPAYFLTGDGPCHVENAQILHDFWVNHNTALYSRFFEVVYLPNPNWMSTVVMALLLFVVKGVIAEKIFISVYVLLYLGGFYLLLRKLNGGNSWWLLSIFIFVFTHTLFKGFYNFSFSIAFYFWVVWCWLRFMERRNLLNGLLVTLFTGLIFFTHLLAFVFAAFTCGALIVTYAFAADTGIALKQRFVCLFKAAAFLGLFLSPFLIIMRWFTEKEGGMQIKLEHHFRRLKELAEFNYIINVQEQEVLFAKVAGITLLLLGGLTLLRFRKGIKIHRYDGFLLSLLFVTFVYLSFPEDFMGRLILITMRAQLFVFIMMACCVSYMLPSEKIKNAGGIVLFGCFLVLCFIRIPCLVSAGEAVTDINSSIPCIKPNSVVLPLDFAPNGKDKNGNMVADRNWLFSHACQYIGTIKPMVVLDNYEANMGYFPLRWKPETNPYLHLSKAQGIEEHPPCADLAGYKHSSGVTVDYILMWGFDSSALKNENFNQFYSEINAGYKIIYRSATNRTILYAKE